MKQLQIFQVHGEEKGTLKGPWEHRCKAGVERKERCSEKRDRVHSRVVQTA